MNWLANQDKVDHLVKKEISMAEYEQKDQTFSLWKNEYKKEGDKKPDYTGSGMINGEKKDISMWINEDKNGKRYLSGKINEPYNKEKSPF